MLFARRFGRWRFSGYAACRGTEQAVTDEPDLNVRGAQYIGRIVVVEDAISGGRGKVRVGDTLWPAQGSDTAKGARVKITGTNGTVFVVEPAA